MTREPPYLIGIAGPSGAGKSFLSEHLARELNNPAILPLDAYYPDLSHLSLDERNRLNFDDPALLDFPLLFSQVATLARGETVQQPLYDFAHHTRMSETRVVAPSEFVIVEGLFALYWPDLRTLLQTRVYVDMNDGDCLERRIARDVQQRGRTTESVTKQFRESVAPMADLYVRPTAQGADVKINGGGRIEQEVASVLAHVRGQRVR
jgi:uridine kinase